MDFEDEYDYPGWNLSGEKRSSPKKGRRATSDTNHVDLGTNPSEFLDSPFKGLDIKGFTGETSQAAPPKPPRRNMNGWAETSTNFNKGNDFESPVRKSNIKEDDENDNVGLIPDLDDFQEEDFVSQVAKAPNVSVNRVATYKELDNDLHRHSAFVLLNDVDLKALTRCISLETEVKEDDCPWTWDTLMADVASKLNSDQSLDEEAN